MVVRGQEEMLILDRQVFYALLNLFDIKVVELVCWVIGLYIGSFCGCSLGVDGVPLSGSCRSSLGNLLCQFPFEHAIILDLLCHSVCVGNILYAASHNCSNGLG